MDMVPPSFLYLSHRTTLLFDHIFDQNQKNNGRN